MTAEITRRPALRLSTSGQEKVSIGKIRRDGGTQPRAGLSEEHVEHLIEAIENGDQLPAVVLFFDGTDYWLADGFHRFAAHQRKLIPEIAADVRQGDRRDAVLHSVGANRSHGLPRSRADLQRAIETLLRDQEWGKWSDREIARQIGCSHMTVGGARSKLTSTGQIVQLETRMGADGKERALPAPRPAPSGPSLDSLINEYTAIETRGATIADRAALLRISEQADNMGAFNLGSQAAALLGTLASKPATHEQAYERIHSNDGLLHWQARAAAVSAQLAFDPQSGNTSLRLPGGTLIVSHQSGAEDLVAHIKGLEAEQTAAVQERALPALPPGFIWRKEGEFVRVLRTVNHLLSISFAQPADAVAWAEMASAQPITWGHVPGWGRDKRIALLEDSDDPMAPAALAALLAGDEPGEVQAPDEEEDDEGDADPLPPPVKAHYPPLCKNCRQPVTGGVQYSGECPGCYHLGHADSGTGTPEYNRWHLEQALAYTSQLPASEFRARSMSRIAEELVALQGTAPAAATREEPSVKAALPAAPPEPKKDVMLANARHVLEGWLSEQTSAELQLLAAAVWRHFSLEWYEASRPQQLGVVVDRLLGGLEAEYQRGPAQAERIDQLIEDMLDEVM